MLFEKVKNKEMKASRIKLIVLAVIAIGLIVVSGVHNLFLGGKRLDATQLESAVGKYVTYDVTYNFGWYIERLQGKTRSSMKTVFYEYLIVVPTENTDQYMGLLIPVKDAKIHDSQVDETNEYFDGERDSEPRTITVSGYVREMNSEEKRAFLDVIPEVLHPYAFPYVIDTRRLNNLGIAKELAMILAAVGLGILLYVFFQIYAIYTLRHHRSLVKYLKDNPEKEDDMDRLINDGGFVGGFKVAKNLIIYHTATRTYLMYKDDVVWAYQHVTQHRVYGIPTTKTRLIQLGYSNGKLAGFPINSEKAAHEVLDMLYENHDSIVIGYSNDLGTLFKKDINRFKSLRTEQAKQNESQETTESVENTVVEETEEKTEE